MKRILYLLEIILGIALFLLAAYVFTSEQTKTISGNCIGFGSVLIVFGIGNLVYSFVLSKDKESALLKQKMIEVNDERNVAIKEKSGAKVNQIMTYLLSAFVIGLSLFGADKAIIICAASLILIKGLLYVLMVNRYTKVL
ncbi:hypothetical protein [Dehalococcoides mccartyi]|uniref:hypothetical protein n=1 Tax=Dehalococcoides mccartyi TaxID=61435 RepID=UPI000804C11F|nr:hypothetical protein [Dehalococcoides mccartyi]OBW60913.1 MAG: hypothetical protein A9181_06425 [Dehalococcoides mccartyi]